MLPQFRLLFLLALLLPALPAWAEIYKYYDSEGNLVLSDEVPKENADKVQRLEARPVMTMPALAPDGRRPAASAKPVTARRAESAAPVIRVQSPVAEQTYPRGGDAIPVAISVSPGLKDGQRLEVQLDGVASDNLSVINPDQLDRGAHALQLRVVGADGKTQASVVVPFYIHQRSVQKPRAGK